MTSDDKMFIGFAALAGLGLYVVTRPSSTASAPTTSVNVTAPLPTVTPAITPGTQLVSPPARMQGP